MKYALGIFAIVILNSCNTSIGLYRDTAQAVSWSKQKLEECENRKNAANEQTAELDDGAPIY